MVFLLRQNAVEVTRIKEMIHMGFLKALRRNIKAITLRRKQGNNFHMKQCPCVLCAFLCHSRQGNFSLSEGGGGGLLTKIRKKYSFWTSKVFYPGVEGASWRSGVTGEC